MSFRRLALSMVLGLSFTTGVAGQQAPARDPQAIALLARSLAAAAPSGGTRAIGDFTASGTITYFWAGEEHSGPATVRARGSDQFRLDAQLPEGTRSFVASHGRGKLREVTGHVSEIPLHNTVNTGILTFPYPAIATALGDPQTLVTSLGTVELSGGRAHRIRVQRGGPLSKLMVTDYFVDAVSGLIVRASDETHPAHTASKGYSHDVEFADYRNVGGVNVPMTVREKVIGQTIWELHLADVSFNVGLTEAEFGLEF